MSEDTEYYHVPSPGFWLVSWALCNDQDKQLDIWLDAYTRQLRRDQVLEDDALPLLSEALEIYFEFWQPPAFIKAIDALKWFRIDS